MTRTKRRPFPTRLSNLLLAALVAAFFMPSLGYAFCLSRDDLAKELWTRYRERVITTGLASNGRLIEVFRNEGSESWTLVQTTPGGIACIMMAGEGWHAVVTPKGEPS